MHNASIQSFKAQHVWLFFSKSEDIFKAVRFKLVGGKDNDKSFSQMRARSSEQLVYMHLITWLKAFSISVGIARIRVNTSSFHIIWELY